MKSSGSGPKKAVSPMPVDLRYFSALMAMLRGSREYGSFVIGSTMLQMSDSVGSAMNGSMTAVSASGTTSMSEAWIACQPRIEEPSNPRPPSKTASLSSSMGTVKCCQMPRKSLNLRSTNSAFFSLMRSRTCFGVRLAISFVLLPVRAGRLRPVRVARLVPRRNAPNRPDRPTGRPPCPFCGQGVPALRARPRGRSRGKNITVPPWERRVSSRQEAALSDPRDEAARLYREHGAAVYRRCLRLLRDREAARDATQEVFVKLVRDMKRLKDRVTALPWIYRVATNHCLNLRRDAARRGEDALEPALEVSPGAPPDGHPDRYPDRQLAQQVLSRFDGTTQAIAVGDRKSTRLNSSHHRISYA